MAKDSSAHVRRSQTKVVVIVVLIIAALGALATYRLLIGEDQTGVRAASDVVNVMVAEAQSSTVETSSVHTGKLTAENEVNIVPKIPGKVTSVNVELGDQVEEGDVLFLIDPADVKAQADQAEIQRDAASKARSTADDAVKNAKKAVKDMKKMLKDAKKAAKEAEKAAKKAQTSVPSMSPVAGGDASGAAGAAATAAAEQAQSMQEMVAQAKSAVNQAESAVSQAEAGELQARSGYDQANAQYKLAGEGVNAANDALEDCSIRSPISGYVTALTVQRGGMASQAMPAVVVTGEGKLQVMTTVSESLVNSLHKGDPVDVRVRAVSPDPFEGAIRSVIPSPSSGQTTYPVSIDLNRQDDRLRSGMFAEIVMVTGKAENVITIPSEAVIIRNGAEIVAVVGDGDKIQIHEVETGLDNGETIEVVSGVSPGDRVVYEGQHYLDADSEIKILESK
jgi:RND family efflux transporter MFP subunit